jgi:hypothetical protein
MKPQQLAIVILMAVAVIGILLIGLGGSNNNAKPSPGEFDLDSLPPLVKIIGSISDKFTPRLKKKELTQSGAIDLK